MSCGWDNYVFPAVSSDKNAFECSFSRWTDRKFSWIDSFNISFLAPFLSLRFCLRLSLLNIYQYLIIGYGMMFAMFKEFWGLSVTLGVACNRVSIQQSMDYIVKKKKADNILENHRIFTTLPKILIQTLYLLCKKCQQSF